MDKIVYKCKNCTWKASVPALWSDLRPGVCGNKKCGTNFKKNPEELVSELVESVPVVKKPAEVKQPENKKPQHQHQQHNQKQHQHQYKKEEEQKD